VSSGGKGGGKGEPPPPHPKKKVIFVKSKLNQNIILFIDIYLNDGPRI